MAKALSCPRSVDAAVLMFLLPLVSVMPCAYSLVCTPHMVSAPPAQNPQASGDTLVASQGDACAQVICSFYDLDDGVTAQPFQLV